MLGLAQAQQSAHNRVRPIEEILRRFEVSEAGCHEWTGARNGKGYGVILLGGGSKDKKVLLLAHRLQWMHHHGPVGPATVIMHKCDNRRCINIDHLQAGTQVDNMRDMIAKGRQNFGGRWIRPATAHESAQKKLTSSDAP